MTVRSPLHAALCAVLLITQLTGCGGGAGGDSSGGSSSGSSVGGSGSGLNTGTGTATLQWVPPTTNEDGAPTTLNGFNVYAGLSQYNLQPVTTVGPYETSATVNNLPIGTVYFAVTALGTNGMESDLSNIASKTFN